MRKIYRFVIPLVLAAFCYSSGQTQDLIKSRKSSYFTFVYKIDNEKAYKLYKDMWDFETSFLDKPYDLYPSDSVYEKELPVGHYLFIHTNEGAVECELESVNNVDLKLLNNYRDLVMIVHDSLGNELTDLEVKIRSRKIPFERETNTYRLKKSNRKGLVRVSYQGHESFFEITRRYNNGFFVRTGRKAIRNFPLNHILSPLLYLKSTFVNLINGWGVYPPGFYYRVKRLFTAKEQTGYVAFNKPLYKPNDTIRFKAFITSRKGRPYNKPVKVFLNKHYPEAFSKKLTTIDPFRKGAYEFSFTPGDTLNLTLDSDYTVELRSRKGNLLVSSSFRFEDYELKQNNYFVRSENKADGRPSRLYLKGVDSNDRPLYDVRAEILLRPKLVHEYFRSRVFVPDTLWFHNTGLESIGETQIQLPDSLFPSVKMNYEAVVSFLNTENERVERRVELTFDEQPFPVHVEINKDSLLLSAISGYDLTHEKIRLQEIHASGDRISHWVTVPHREQVNRFAVSYSVFFQNEHTILNVEELPDDLQIFANSTVDSLFVTTENPRRIPFRYFLFRNQKLIEQSETASLNLKRRANWRDAYSLSVQFIWAGRPVSREYNVHFDKNNLQIKLDHPPLVYPGQKTNFTITVRDAKGDPVKNVDLTAYSITKKFSSPRVAAVPNLARASRRRIIFNEFDRTETELKVSTLLDYAYWRKILGLDSIAFYKFLFPQTGYYEYRTSSAIAQFSPFVINHGYVESARVVYVDGQPVYYEGVSSVEPYSLAIKPGKHKIALRLSGALITLDSIVIEAGEKLIFSINRQKLPPGCSIIKMPYKFSREEISALARYFMSITYTTGRRPDAYILQGNRYHLLPSHGSYYGNGGLVGPFYPGKALYYEKDGFKTSFDYEPFYRYEFSQDVLKLRQAGIHGELKTSYNRYRKTPSFADEAYTEQSIRDYWDHLENETGYSFKRFPDSRPTFDKTGRLTLEVHQQQVENLFVRATFIVSLSSADEYYVFPGPIHDEEFTAGHYQAVIIFNNERYLKVDSIMIRAYGSNYFQSDAELRAPDSLSIEILKLVKKWSRPENYVDRERQIELQNVRSLYYKQASYGEVNFNHYVSGRVVDDQGVGLPGVNVVVKGTAVGTATDMDGYYGLSCPENGILVFSFIGFSTREMEIERKPKVDVEMQADVQSLSEVVVVGYGAQQRMALTGAVNQLSGRVAGISISPLYGRVLDSVQIRMRGLSEASIHADPLVVVDGQIVLLSEVDKNKVTAIEIINGADAVSLYGSRASNGVILISTRPGATKEYLQDMGKPLRQLDVPEQLPGNSLRKNFRDYAFWQPRLQTDEVGKVEFEVTFPDDITGWSAYVLGMASKRRTGQTMSTIQSYKPLMAQISQPHFLTEGDESTAIGKITNYDEGKIRVLRSISINDNLVDTDAIDMENSKTDSIRLHAIGTDSVSVEYKVIYNNYSDGELRNIPVYPKGAMEVNGIFAALDNDTTFSLDLRPYDGTLKIYAQADLIDVFLDEITFLKNYPHECNEQLASRLIALVLEKNIRNYRGEKFKYEIEVQKAVKKLVGFQNPDGSWGWWKNDNGDPWITLHVAKSLLMAENSGYGIAIDKTALINYLSGQLTDLDRKDRMRAMLFLMEHGQTVNAADEAVEIKSGEYSVFEKLLAERLLQLSGHQVDWKWIDSVRSVTIKGNYYWGEEKENLADNSILNTLLVYQMSLKEGKRSKDLVKIRNYFLEKRKKSWRNTYESSLILESLLPVMMQAKSAARKVNLNLQGDVETHIDAFPFEYTGQAIRELKVSKTGSSPVYFTAFTEQWNPNPVKTSEDFIVQTSFDKDNLYLISGKPVKLNVRVEVKRDAEYVMIEVPIPAGCSYSEKPQSRSNGEVHREYYNDKTNIFCKYLKKGKYDYSIYLIPRYKGVYTMNPAAAECMYFPTLFGREDIKKIQVR